MAKRKEKQTRQQIIRHRILILVAVVAVFVCLFAAWKLTVRKPSLPVTPPPDPDVTEDIDPGPVLSEDRKKDFFTFLVLGRDSGGGGNTDTMMVVAYDVPKQTVHVLNIYRDTMVNVSWDLKRINSVYNVLGIDGLKEHLDSLLGFIPDYYIKVELDAFGELVDAIGGVDFEVPCNMSYDDPTQDLHIHFDEGMQHLDGDDAMRVIRWRKNNDGSGVSVGDTGRVEIQQDFIMALAKQCLKIGNITKVGEFARIFNTRVDSDLALGEMVWFGQQALGMDTDSLGFHTLPGNYNGSAWSRTYHNYQSYVLPYGDETAELVNAYFNPYYADVTTDMMDIMSVNFDGSLSASGGILADKKAGAPPVRTTPKPAQTQEPEPEDNPPAEESPQPEESSQPEESLQPEESSQPEESLQPEESSQPEEIPQLEESAQPNPTLQSSPSPQPTSNVLPAIPVPADT